VNEDQLATLQHKLDEFRPTMDLGLAIEKSNPLGELAQVLVHQLNQNDVLVRRALRERWMMEVDTLPPLPSSWAWLKATTPASGILSVESALVLCYATRVASRAAAMNLCDAHAIPGTQSGCHKWFQHHQIQLSEDAFAPGTHLWWQATKSKMDFKRLGDCWRQIDLILKERWPADFKADVFTQLYTGAFPNKMRKRLGEFYTSRDIVEYILEQIGYHEESTEIANKTLCDVACGSGSFLVPAMQRYLRATMTLGPQSVVSLLEKQLISGIDINPFACATARLRLVDTLLPAVADFGLTKAIRNALHKLPIQQGNGLTEIVEKNGRQRSTLIPPRFDFVVGNPPYLRIQRLRPGKAKTHYLNNYDAATGRFDLYYLFIERGLQLLKDNGRLGYITSNKFMSTKAGVGIRNVIHREAVVERILDLADTKLFSAAVLPAIVVLRKRLQSTESVKQFPYTTVREVSTTVDRPSVANNLFDMLSECSQSMEQRQVIGLKAGPRELNYEIRSFLADQPDGSEAFWHFLSPDERMIVEQMTTSNRRLQDLAKISCGIKSTADNVFVHPMTTEFVDKMAFEKCVVKPYVQAPNVLKWRIRWNGSREKVNTHILYPHRLAGDRVRAIELKKIPKTADYLLEHKAQLVNRRYVRAAGRQWYELWVPQNPRLFEAPYKLITPDFATHNTFALDDQKRFAGGSCFVIVPNCQDRDMSFYLLGLLNSKLMNFFHKVKASTFIYAGRYRYGASYLADYPIVPLDDGVAKNKRLQEIIGSLAKKCFSKTIPKLEWELDDRVYELYGIDTTQRRIVEASIAQQAPG